MKLPNPEYDLNVHKEVYPTNSEEIDPKVTIGFSAIRDDDPMQKIVRFKDISSGEYLSFYDTKTCVIEQDPMCKQGLETLERLGADKLDITFLFGHHGDPKDFYDIFKNKASRTCLEQASFIAVEANGSLSGEGVLVEPRGTGRGLFQQAQMQWLQSNDKLALPCDIDTPEDPAISGGTLRHAMAKLWELRGLVSQSTHMTPQEQKRLLATNTLYYHLIREEMMLGQLGYWIYELEKRGALDDERVSIPFMLGSFHQPIIEKAAAYLGTPPNAYDTHPPTERASLFTRIARQGYASYEELDTFAEL